MTARPTIRDVAAAAGVSVTTVSHAINRKGRVDERTRERVLDIAQRLGYRANRHAVGLRSGRTATFAFVLPHFGVESPNEEALGHEHYMRLMVAVAGAAFAEAHGLLLVPPMRAADDIASLAADGVIVADPISGDPTLAELDARNVPVVTIGRDLERPDDPWYVISRADHNTVMVLDHLAEQGAQRIALLVPDMPWSWVGDTRRGYEEWAAARGADSIVVGVPLGRMEGGAHAAALALLAGPGRPDAILALAERYPAGVLRAAAELGLDVPGDVLVACGVDSELAEQAVPPVTAIDLPPSEYAEAAVRLLLARLAGEEPRGRVVRARLRVRASTRR